MQLGQHSTEGCHAPKLLGCYEQALHPHFECFIARGFDAVLNIGCAEGHYAIGLARRMPGTKIFAHDLNEDAQKTCRSMAQLNGVAARTRIDGLFSGGDFERFAALDTLVMADIEGAEEALLGPERGTTETLTARFQPTDHVTRSDQLLPMWEWRMVPTPWLVLEPFSR